MNPSKAQIDRMMNGPSGMAIIWGPEHSPEKNSVLVPLNTFKNLSPAAWKALPLPSRLGIELLYITKDDADHAVFAVGGGRNMTLELLTMDCDPESARFGQAGHKIDGGALFKYRDGGVHDRLGRAPFDALEIFIAERVAAIKDAKANDVLQAAKAEYAKMKPVELKKCFKRYRAEQAEKFKDMAWEKQACPVKFEGEEEVCESCGKDGEEGKALMRCGKCKKVVYCGRECQAEDWKAHKPFCGAA